MVALFVLGITGYVGGTVVEKLLARYKDFETVALVRSEDKAKKVEAAFPQIHTVIGDLDSNEIIAEESSKVDIVLSAANCDHEGHIKSIYNGMAKHDGPTYLIHTSGTGILTDPTLSAVGEPFQTEISDREFDDVRDVHTLTSLPDSHLHRLVDRLVIETAPENAKQLIVCPPLIYGRGSGPDNQGSIQLPIYIEEVLQRKQAFAVGKGLGVWSNVHVQDLADLYLLLIEEALKEGGGKAT